jgi:hypothetical protein
MRCVILHGAGPASHRRSQLSSNVRPHVSHSSPPALETQLLGKKLQRYAVPASILCLIWSATCLFLVSPPTIAVFCWGLVGVLLFIHWKCWNKDTASSAARIVSAALLYTSIGVLSSKFSFGSFSAQVLTSTAFMLTAFFIIIVAMRAFSGAKR